MRPRREQDNMQMSAPAKTQSSQNQQFGMTVGQQDPYAQVKRQPGVQAAQEKPKTATGEKVGRNDPCPCGSGKKYKKCCGS